MDSKLELHIVAKPCVNRRDYTRIYSNRCRTGVQRVKFYGITRDPNKKVIKRYLENCGFFNILVKVEYSSARGMLVRSLVIYAEPGRSWTQSKTPPYFFAQDATAKFTQSPREDARKAEEALNRQRFESQRPLPKKVVMRLKPGTWIEVKWLDTVNTVMLLLEKPEDRAGDVSLRCYDPHTQDVHSHAVHSQVVRVRGAVVVPIL